MYTFLEVNTTCSHEYNTFNHYIKRFKSPKLILFTAALIDWTRNSKLENIETTSAAGYEVRRLGTPTTLN